HQAGPIDARPVHPFDQQRYSVVGRETGRVALHHPQVARIADQVPRHRVCVNVDDHRSSSYTTRYARSAWTQGGRSASTAAGRRSGRRARGEGLLQAGCPPRVVGHPARYFFTRVAVNDPLTPVSPSPVSSLTFRAMASGLLMRRPGLAASAASRSSQKWLVREHGCFGQLRMGATSGAGAMPFTVACISSTRGVAAPTLVRLASTTR